MKIIKTANYKIAFNSRKELALKLLEWHGGQWSPLYSVGSTWLAGEEVPIENIEMAIDELEDIVQKKVNYPNTVTDEDIIEVKELQNQLKVELEKSRSQEDRFPIDTSMGLEDDNPIEAKSSKKIKIAGKKEKMKEDGTGPFEDSFQNKKYEKGKRKKIAQVKPNPLDGKSNQQARVIINRKIIPQDKITGFFSDESWQGVQQIWNAFSEAGLDWNIMDSDYYPTNYGRPMGVKIWKIEINFTNNKGKPTILYGTVTASGAGTIYDPLSRYDITAYVG